ncbi:MAG: DUF2868 domain-containing protein [Myxococcales bacterium]|nr:DUF2868 domain-containing protein [Myxococcales bacterium]MCB9542967.1 DUF2868 domain-containing protein [Myxococcales bacterium]MCB9551538.1 DUF2868 domain-containing protein [Myxococcales bacterium]
MPAPPLSLEDLVDLELRIAEDEHQDPQTLLARDRPIGATLTATDRTERLRGWLAALRARGAATGERVARALRLTRLALLIAGLTTGWGTARWLLAYDGRTPVNVVHALAVLVGLQLALLLLLALFALLRRLTGDRIRALGDLRALAVGLVRLIDRLQLRADAAWRARDPEARACWKAAWHRLNSRRSLYHGVERWQLLAATQGFGVTFNLGALAALLTAVALSDLAFAWATTLAVEPADVAALVRLLAAPWSWIWPAAAPDAALVEATRYSRLAAAYAGADTGRAADPRLIGDWWRFLAMAITVYGLLPRLLLHALARRRAAAVLQALPLHTPDIDRVLRRLEAPRVETRAPDPEHPHAPPTAETPHLAPAPPATPWRAVTWRDIPLAPERITALIEGPFAGAARGVVDVGDYDAEARALQTLAADDARVLVLAEAFEAPDKAIRRFLRALRDALGPDRPIIVGLVHEATPDGYRPVDPDTLRLWRQHLAANEDPWLGVEALEQP